MRPRRILFANEFGSGHGHHVLLRAIEQELRKTQPDLISRFILPPHSLAAYSQEHTDTYFPAELKAPSVKAPSVNSYLAHSLCTLLLTDPSTLISRISLWQSEFASFMPDLIVADYAPSLSMAAAGKVPCFVIGSGYTLPPPELDFCLPVNNQGSYDRETAETVWLEKLNAVLAQSGAGKINYLPQLNQGDGYGLFTIPLFDPYWRQRQQHYLGVYHPDGSPMPSATNDGVVIAYFSKPPESFRILDGLIESGLPTFAHFGVTTDVLRARASNTNVKLVEKPFNLAKDLPGRALTVHTGSLGMSAAGVYAGLPQVGLYHYDEGMGNCRSFDIAQIGSSGWIAKIKPSDIAEMMQKAANSSPMRKYATALSQRYSEFRDSSAVSRAVPLVHQLMG